MQTIFVMVKCELGKAYAVADEAVLSVEQVSEVVRKEDAAGLYAVVSE